MTRQAESPSHQRSLGRRSRWIIAALYLAAFLLLLLYYFNYSSVFARLEGTLRWWADFIAALRIPPEQAPIPVFGAAGALEWLAYFSATAMALASAGALVRLLEVRGTHRVLLAWITCFCALVSLYMLILGFAGALSAWVLYALVTAGFLLAFAALWRYGRFPSKRELIAAAEQWREGVVEIAALRGNGLLLFVCALSLLWCAMLASCYYPMSFDALSYHLPPLVQWIQTGRFALTETGVVYADSYPKAANLFFLWQMIFLGNDTQVRFVQTGFAAYGLLAVYALCRELGIARTYAFLAGAVFLVTPIVQAQASVAFVDIAYSALAVASTVYVLAYWREPRVAWALAAGAAIGLMAGTKSTGIFMGGLAAAALALGALVQAGSLALRLRRTVLVCAVAGGVLLALGGVWYLRTWYYFGSPFWPFALKVAGVPLPFPSDTDIGWLTKHAAWNKDLADLYGPYEENPVWRQILLSWTEVLPLYNYFGRAHGGLGPLWLIAALPATLAAFAIALYRRDARLLGVLAAYWGFFALLQPAPAVPRYTIFMAALGACCIAYVLAALPRMPERIARGAVGALVVVTFVLASNPNNQYNYAPKVVARAFQQGRQFDYPPYEVWLYEEIVPPGAQVVFYTPRENHFYYLFGRDLTRHIAAIPPDRLSTVEGVDGFAVERGAQFVFLPKDFALTDELAASGRYEPALESWQYTLLRRVS